jgi:transcriptional regulator with XRE-family HTH domain
MHNVNSNQDSRGSVRPAAPPIGARIRQLRGEKGLSQGDIEKRAGLLRCYISRVENGYKTPSIETLERFASALDVPLYRLFYDGAEPPPARHVASRPLLETLLGAPGEGGPNPRLLRRLGTLCRRMENSKREVMISFAELLASRTRGVSAPVALGAQPPHRTRRSE